MRLILTLFIFVLTASAQSLPWIDISGNWRTIDGDDMRYAEPGFDDSVWSEVNLPMPIPRKPSVFLWLRRTVEIPPNVDLSDLSLTLGAISEAYEVYVNGVMVGATGPLTLEKAQIARPRTFDLPPQQRNKLTIAIRVAKFQVRLNRGWEINDKGPHILTSTKNAPRNLGSFIIDERRVQRMPRFIVSGLCALMAVLLILVWLSERSRQDLFWLALLLWIGVWEMLDQMLGISLDSTPWARPLLPYNLITIALPLAVMAQLALAAFRVPFRWPILLIWLPPLVSFLPLDSMGIPLVVSDYAGAAMVLVIVLWPWPITTEDRRPKWERVSYRIAILLALLNHAISWEYGRPLRWLSAFRIVTGPYDWPRYYTVLAGLAFILMVLLMRRLVEDRQSKVHLENEMEAARAVQQLLLSQSIKPPPNYRIDVAYEPAQQVGGDFYWTHTTADGALLLMVGDVSGKGLKAAMLVNLIMGALRREHETNPAAILAGLNRAIAGELHGGFVTACCLRAEAGGEVKVANAGHIAPYLAGQETEVASGLPLGLALESDYEETVLHIAPATALTLVSDGVVEAANSKGELFGFDRTRDISNKPAAKIAATAKAWGQNDDITVVTLRRQT